MAVFSETNRTVTTEFILEEVPNKVIEWSLIKNCPTTYILNCIFPCILIPFDTRKEKATST